jgi:hypothetical protein
VKLFLDIYASNRHPTPTIDIYTLNALSELVSNLLKCYTTIIKQVTLFKLSLKLMINLQNTQTLQLNLNRNYLEK